MPGLDDFERFAPLHPSTRPPYAKTPTVLRPSSARSGLPGGGCCAALLPEAPLGLQYVRLNGIICTSDIRAVVGFDQVILYRSSVVIGPTAVSLGNCLLKNTSGSERAFFGFKSVAGKLSTSKSLNRLM